jgi:uncharacterized protein YjbI with pentapeptide repeats
MATRTSADLSAANLKDALLDDANFEAATVGSTIFGGIDLSSCRGLDVAFSAAEKALQDLDLSRKAGQLSRRYYFRE